MSDPSPQLDLTGTGYCASFNFRRVSRAVTALYDDALQDSGIRSTQFAILTAVAKAQPVSIGSIADVLVMDATTLTRSLIAVIAVPVLLALSAPYVFGPDKAAIGTKIAAPSPSQS